MTQIHTNQWERLRAVINWTGMSIHAFACEIGLKRSENLYRIKNQKNGISRKLVSFIVNRYPEVSDIWLLTGSGVMLRNENYVGNITVPYFKSGIQDYLEDPQKSTLEFGIPNPTSAKLAIDVMPNIIEHIVPAGSVAFLKQTEIENIVYGKPYHIVTENFTEFCILIADMTDTNYVYIKGQTFGNEAITRVAISEIIALFNVVGYIRNL